MSRTVHHVPDRHRTHRTGWSAGPSGPWTAHTLEDLRYSDAELSRSRATGRRPIPAYLVRTFAAHRYPRATGVRMWDPYEATARARLRTFRRSAHKYLYAATHAATTDALLTVAEDLDHPPTRHRHRNLWES
jgi:hypothetical protein